MRKNILAVLLGILLIGTLGAAVVSAVASNDTKENVSTTALDNTKAKDSFGQMHALCGKYMSSGNLDSKELESMHKSCGEYMNSNGFKGSGMMSTSSGNNNGGFSCH